MPIHFQNISIKFPTIWYDVRVVTSYPANNWGYRTWDAILVVIVLGNMEQVEYLQYSTYLWGYHALSAVGCGCNLKHLSPSLAALPTPFRTTIHIYGFEASYVPLTCRIVLGVCVL